MNNIDTMINAFAKQQGLTRKELLTKLKNKKDKGELPKSLTPIINKLLKE